MVDGAKNTVEDWDLVFVVWDMQHLLARTMIERARFSLLTGRPHSERNAERRFGPFRAFLTVMPQLERLDTESVGLSCIRRI